MKQGCQRMELLNEATKEKRCAQDEAFFFLRARDPWNGSPKQRRLAAFISGSSSAP